MTQLAVAPESPIATASAAIFMNPETMRALVQFADLMSKAAFAVPKHLQNKPSDCLAIAMQATHWGMDPFVVAQKTHLVNGTLGYEAQLINAVVQNSGFVNGMPEYEYRGTGLNLECRVAFIPRGGTELKWGQWLKSADVKVKNSPLWQVNPAQQLGYLQVKNWARAYCPGAILGVYSDDELVDFSNQPSSNQPDPTPRNVHMGAADVVEPVNKRQAYAEDKFTENLPKWRKLIDGGKKTADEIIKTVETTALLSEEQKAQIRTAPAKVAEKHPLEIQMEAAIDMDSLNLLADQMRSEQDEELYAHLTNVYQAAIDRLSTKE